MSSLCPQLLVELKKSKILKIKHKILPPSTTCKILSIVRAVDIVDHYFVIMIKILILNSVNEID